MRTEEELQALLDKHMPNGADDPDRQWPGTYGQGVEDALLWALGHTDEDPLAE